MHSGVFDRYHSFDAPVEVALHHVRGTYIDMRRGGRKTLSAAETIDPAVFQETAHNTFHSDSLRETGNTRPQTAHAAHDQLDMHAGKPRFVKRVDNAGIDQRVHFH